MTCSQPDGTTEAAVQLVRELGGEVIGSAFLIELVFLNGRAQLDDHPCTA